MGGNGWRVSVSDDGGVQINGRAPNQMVEPATTLPHPTCLPIPTNEPFPARTNVFTRIMRTNTHPPTPARAGDVLSLSKKNGGELGEVMVFFVFLFLEYSCAVVKKLDCKYAKIARCEKR